MIINPLLKTLTKDCGLKLTFQEIGDGNNILFSASQHGKLIAEHTFHRVGLSFIMIQDKSTDEQKLQALFITLAELIALSMMSVDEVNNMIKDSGYKTLEGMQQLVEQGYEDSIKFSNELFENSDESLDTLMLLSLTNLLAEHKKS